MYVFFFFIQCNTEPLLDKHQFDTDQICVKELFTLQIELLGCN